MSTIDPGQGLIGSASETACKLLTWTSASRVVLRQFTLALAALYNEVNASSSSDSDKSFIIIESHTNRGDELEGVKRVADTDVESKAARSLFNTSIRGLRIL